jgi:hypothetical protein
MSSSSSSDSVALFNYLQTYVQRIGDSILVVLGTISCLFSLIIFLRKDLRKSPCAIYFIAYNIGNLFYIFLVILVILVQGIISIDPGAYNLAYCRFRFYFYYLFGVLSPFSLILASIDRMLITSLTVRVRRWSTRRVAYITIIGMTLFWVIFHIHLLIYMNIYQNGVRYSCTYTPGIYTVFVKYYQLIVRGILAPLLMLIFGLLTVRNIRSARRITPAPDVSVMRNTVVIGPQNFTRKDRQFILMLFIDIIIYILCTIPLPIYLIYIQVTQYDTKTAERQAIESFINSFTLFTTFIPTCLGFYTNFLVSKTFRQNVKKVLQETKVC